MNRATLSLVMFLAIGPTAALPADNATTPGELRTDATPYSISIEWDVAGDANHNAACTVQYRKQGSPAWRKALPLMRVDYAWWYHTEKAERAINMLAGSLMFLEPGTSYEVQLDLSDPDGGAASKLLTIATRPLPQAPAGGRTLHVSPGNGGGSGAKDDPFRGLKAAQQAARPGDTFVLAKGDYGAFYCEVSGEPGKYIVFKAAEDGGPVFSTLRFNGSHLWFEGLRLQRAEESNGLKAQDACQDIVICRNQFNGFHYAITLTPKCRYWHITDNTIVGDNDPRQPTTQGGISGEGVELNHSSGHVVAYNRITRVADGVSYPERNCDIFGNEIFDVSDDGIEPDYGFANVRMWANRITNAQNFPLSFQPMKCGPWYFVRNVTVGGRGTFKFRVQDRFVLVNNTFITWGSTSDRMHNIFSSFSRNNLYILAGSPQPIWTARDCNQPEYCLPNNYERNWMTDVDYDGFDWGDSADAFRWYNAKRRFADVAAFAEAVGIEQHGRRVRKEEIFAQWKIPTAVEQIEPQHFALKAGSAAVDAGAVVPNLADDFTGGAPDLGAYELDRPLPHYGPRPR